jgi:WD40 repeat protein
MCFDGSYVVTGTRHGHIYVWPGDLRPKEEKMEPHSPPPHFRDHYRTSDNDLGMDEDRVPLCSRSPLFLIPRAHNGPITSLYVSANGAMILTGAADGAVRIWHTTGQKKSRTGRRGYF